MAAIIQNMLVVKPTHENSHPNHLIWATQVCILTENSKLWKYPITRAIPPDSPAITIGLA